MESKDVLFTGVDVRAHLPSQLNEPIPVEPVKTLLQRLPKPISAFSVELECTHKVSDAFPNRPRENHLEIIAVTLVGKRIARHFFILVALTMSTAFFNYINFCCCAISPPVDSVPHRADGVLPFPYPCYGLLLTPVGLPPEWC